MKDYLFAYGTLADDTAPKEIAAAMKRLKFAGEGFVFGRLYDIGEYPGAILSERGGDRAIDSGHSPWLTFARCSPICAPDRDLPMAVNGERAFLFQFSPGRMRTIL